MKTKSAFAFRNFDSSRILQRPFFKDFYFEPDKSDVEILESLSKETEDLVESWERNLYIIKATHERLARFRYLIDRHNEKRLNKYNKKKSESKGIKITELRRPAPVMEYFSASLSVLELMNKFEKLYHKIDKKLQAGYRKDFANRLKRIRKDLRLTYCKTPPGLLQYSWIKEECRSYGWRFVFTVYFNPQRRYLFL